MEELIKEAMAKAFFASAWAEAAEEAGQMPSGCEIMDVMPAELDPAAVRAAERLASRMVADNGKSLTDMLAWLEGEDDAGEPVAQGDREPTADMFGHYAAMQAMGTGVGLGDAFGSAVREAIKVPYMEFASCYLERNYFPKAYEVNTLDVCIPGFERLRSESEFILTAYVSADTEPAEYESQWLECLDSCDMGEGFDYDSAAKAVRDYWKGTAENLRWPNPFHLEPAAEDDTSDSPVAFLYMAEVTSEGDDE